MTSFVARSLIGFLLLACVSGQVEAWLRTAPAWRVACAEDYSTCRIGPMTVSMAEASSVLGRIATAARHDPARRFEEALRELVAQAAGHFNESARGAALAAR